MSVKIREDDFIRSVADALQHISYYHPRDYIRALGEAYRREESPAARDAIAQILTNSRMCAEGHRPVCQDTGLVVVFLKIGMGVSWEGARSVEQMVNEAVRRAYLDPENVLRASVVADPLGSRRNTGDNTPAIVHVELVPGSTVEVKVAAKGAGSENKAKFTTLNPSDDVVEWVLKVVPENGGWLVPAGDPRDRRRRERREGDAPREGGGAGPHRHARAQGAGSPEPARGAARRDPRQGQRPRNRGAGPGWPDHCARCEDPRPPHARRLAARRHHPNCAATRHAHFVLDGTGRPSSRPSIRRTGRRSSGRLCPRPARCAWTA